MNALPLLLIGGAAIVLLGKKKRKSTNGRKTSESDSDSPEQDGFVGGTGGLPPWWTWAMSSARGGAEERAKQCSNPEAFLAAVDTAFKNRRDEYLDDVNAATTAAVSSGGSGMSPSVPGVAIGGEGTPLGITFQSDLQMFVDDLFTVHCG